MRRPPGLSIRTGNDDAMHTDVGIKILTTLFAPQITNHLNAY